MLKVTKVQPIATHRDYTRKDRGNFQEVYCKAQEKYVQAGNYRAAEEIAGRKYRPTNERTKGL
jgi:hypothetical protein